MDKIACKILAIVFLFILATSLLMTPIGGETYGENGGSVRCSSNLQLIPQSEQIGGGRISWTIEGEAAQEFRQLLIDSLGNEEFFENADGDNELNEEELEPLLGTSGMLESYLQRGDTLSGFKGRYNLNGFEPVYNIDPDDHISYFGAEITRSSLTTDSILEDTQGLLRTGTDDPQPIKIDFTIRFDESPGKGGPYDIDMSNTDALKSIWQSLIIPKKRDLVIEGGDLPSPTEGYYEFDNAIEHENLLSNETGEAGRYGVVLRNDFPMNSENYSIDPVEKAVTIEENSIDNDDNISVIYAYSPIWEGNSELKHWSYVVGSNNFYNPEYDGSLHLIRTPAGEVLYYSNNFLANDVPDETVDWIEFDPLMNPQILFIIVAIFAYFTAKMPKKYFKDYRSKYPLKYQGRAEKSTFVHLITKLSVIGLLVLYFFPVLGPLYVKGLYLIILSPALMVGSVILSKLVYSKKKSDIPDEIKYPAPKKKATTKRVKKKPIRNVKKVECDRCGEKFTVSKSKNLLAVKCPICGKRQKQLKEGYNYILLDEEGDNAFSIYNDFIKDGLKGLIVTTNLPSKVEEKYGLIGQDIKWVSESASEDYDVLDPKRMDFEITRTISNFAEKQDRGILLIEGLEYLVVENDFEDVTKFIKKVTDITSMNAITLLVHVNPEAFTTNQITTLKKSFDNNEDLRDNDKKSKNS